MNDLYGVDPNAAAAVDDFAKLLRHFGPEHGRFIFDFPPDWYAQVRLHLKDEEVGDVKRLKLTEQWLRTAKRSLLPTKARYSDALAWAKNAENLDNPSGRIGPAGSRPPCIALENVLIDHEALPDCRGGHIRRKAIAYADVARPLMQISRKVVLVDPYFCFHELHKVSGNVRRTERYSNSLKALIQVANAERKVAIFKLMVSRERATLAGEAQFITDYGAIRSDVCSAADIQVEHGFLYERLGQHARYLLGNDCGLHFDHGFDTPIKKNDDSSQHVEWIGRAALTPLLDRFM